MWVWARGRLHWAAEGPRPRGELSGFVRELETHDFNLRGRKMTSWPQLMKEAAISLQALPRRPSRRPGLLRSLRPVLPARGQRWAAAARPGGQAGGRLRAPRGSGRAPRPRCSGSRRFPEWPGFPGRGLAEPRAARPNQRPWPPVSARAGAAAAAWPPPPRAGRGGGESFFFFLIPQTVPGSGAIVSSEAWLQLPTIAPGASLWLPGLTLKIL